jgi:hypothetical protein
MNFKFLKKTKAGPVIIATLLLLGLAGAGLAQTEGDVLWTKGYGNELMQYVVSVEQTSDDGFIMAGFTNSYLSGSFWVSDYWLIKTDANGDTLWTRTFGNLYDNEEAQSVKQTSDGGYIIAGWASDPSLVFNLYVVRTDANGDSVWSWRSGIHDYAYAYDVEETPDNGFMVLGRTGHLLMDFNIYLAKLDANGNPLWGKVYGDSKDQEAYDLEPTLDGGYVITGQEGTCPDYNVFLIKTDANGDSLWGHSYGDSLFDVGYSVEATADGGFLIAGSTESTNTMSVDGYLIRTDSNGDTLWTRRYGRSGEDRLYSICPTMDGYYVASGYYGTGRDVDFYYMKLDDNGDTLWTRAYYYGSDWDLAYSIIQIPDGSYIFAGATASYTEGAYDAIIAKLKGPDLYGSIAGYVTDGEERAPMEDVHVFTSLSETWTNSEGQYTLRDVPIGSSDVTFSHPDCSDTTVTGIAVVYERETRLDVAMACSFGYEYMAGDANMRVGQWPPQVIGGDVTYLVGYFRGINSSCLLGGFYASADVNGDCTIIGSDVTRMVSYFRGTTELGYCADYPSAWSEPGSLPDEAPDGWPNCER